MGKPLLVFSYFFIPLVLNYLSYNYKAVRRVGTILIAYIIGLIIGNTGLLPEDSAGLQDLLTTITIPLAIPLLLFSMDIRSWFRMAGKTFLSLFLGLASVIIPIVAGYFIFRNHVHDSWKIAGMLAGVYSGGTPNLAAIKTALNVDSETYIFTHTYDLIIGAVFLLFVMSVAQRILLTFLKPYKATGEQNMAIGLNNYENGVPFFQHLRKDYLLPLLYSFLAAVVIFALGGSLTFVVPEEHQMVVVILTITTLGILASFIPALNKIKQSYDLGMYFILVFSIVVASMADIRKFSTEYLDVFYWITIVYLGSLIIHALLAKIFGVDADNVLIVGTALTCSPPFVPVVAAALKNKEIIVAGITVGIVGYAIGNYLGVTLAYILKAF